MKTGSKAIAVPYTYLDDCIVVESEMVRDVSRLYCFPAECSGMRERSQQRPDPFPGPPQEPEHNKI
jgi:hypothetical protein